MRNCAAVLTVVILLAASGSVEAKKRAPAGKTPLVRPDLRGAVVVVPVPWGLVSLGGRTLRQLPAGKKNWETLYEVRRGELYRVAAHPSGKLLAVWEHDPDIHLFVPSKRQHLRFPKPPSPSPPNELEVDDLYFSRDGRSAIVFMGVRAARPPAMTIAYRYDLESAAVPPKQLFQQKGLRLHTSARTAVFAVPKNEDKLCYANYMGCWPIAEIRAWEIGDAGAASKVLRSGEGDHLERAVAIPGSDDDRVVLLLEERPKAQGLLRWSYGKQTGEYRALPPRAKSEADASRLSSSGDVIDVFWTEDFGIKIERRTPTGDLREWKFPPLPQRLRMKDTGGVKMVKERSNGDLVVHWSDYLLLVPKAAPSRLLLLPALLGEREWAGADVYVPEPEAMWIGVERRGTRDYYRLAFSEIERHATQWPPSH